MRATKRAVAGGLGVGVLLAVATSAGSLTPGGEPQFAQVAQAGGLTAAEAAALAVQYVQDGWVKSRLVGPPTGINAQQMTAEAADALIRSPDQPPLGPARLAQLSPQQQEEFALPVWLVFLRGDIRVPDEPVPGTGRMSGSPERRQQMALVLDGATGVLLRARTFAPGRQRVAAARLPVVTQPLPKVAIPSMTGPTVVPLPPAPPAPVERTEGPGVGPPRVPSQATATIAAPVRPIS